MEELLLKSKFYSKTPIIMVSQPRWNKFDLSWRKDTEFDIIFRIVVLPSESPNMQKVTNLDQCVYLHRNLKKNVQQSHPFEDVILKIVRNRISCVTVCVCVHTHMCVTVCSCKATVCMFRQLLLLLLCLLNSNGV